MNAHSQFSLCGPSRASFLTSLRPDKLSIWNLQPNILSSKIRQSTSQGGPGIKTLPEWFKSNGYATFGAGKIFHETEPALYSSSALWTEPVYTWMNLARPPSFSKPYVGSWTDSPDVSDSFYSDGQLGIFAAEFIKDRLAQLNQPWLFVLGFWKPQ
jgi:iduronate 2-sulfatase